MARPQTTELLQAHLQEMAECRRCAQMAPPVVTGGPVASKVMLIGQAPGAREPLLGRPFAWTAGRTLFTWFEQACGMTEPEFRAKVYMAAVCRCFPGKKPAGGDRVPAPDEIKNCSAWMSREMAILEPRLVIPVGKLALAQFLPPSPLDLVIGRPFKGRLGGQSFDLIPLPHPSGASPWHRIEPGKTLLKRALELICAHPAFRALIEKP